METAILFDPHTFSQIPCICDTTKLSEVPKAQGTTSGGKPAIGMWLKGHGS